MQEDFERTINHLLAEIRKPAISADTRMKNAQAVQNLANAAGTMADIGKRR